MEISQAYDVLSDETKRSNYDKFGEEGVNGGPQGGHQRGHNPFGDMFGNMFGGGGRHNPGPRRGPNTEAHIEISLRDAYKGNSIPLTFELHETCSVCKGSGAADGKVVTCDTCHGQGQITMKLQIAAGMVQHIRQECPKCHGQGTVIKNPCRKCGGSKVAKEAKTFTVNIDPGSPRAFDTVFHGEAEKTPGLEKGDFIIHIKEGPKDNWGYRRRNNDLFRTEVLTEKEAMGGGWTREITCLDGENKITIKRKKGVRVLPGEVELVKGYGMPLQDNDDEHGNLYIDYVVIFKSKGVNDEL